MFRQLFGKKNTKNKSNFFMKIKIGL